MSYFPFFLFLWLGGVLGWIANDAHRYYLRRRARLQGVDHRSLTLDEISFLCKQVDKFLPLSGTDNNQLELTYKYFKHIFLRGDFGIGDGEG